MFQYPLLPCVNTATPPPVVLPPNWGRRLHVPAGDVTRIQMTASPTVGFQGTVTPPSPATKRLPINVIGLSHARPCWKAALTPSLSLSVSLLPRVMPAGVTPSDLHMSRAFVHQPISSELSGVVRCDWGVGIVRGYDYVGYMSRQFRERTVLSSKTLPSKVDFMSFKHSSEVRRTLV